MKNSEYLFYLINSLSRSEKRFFKLSSQFQTGDKAYLQIFDLIDKMKVYDENILIKKVGDKRKLSVTKNYLYNQILKALRTYNEKESIEIQLYNLILDVEILKSKGLFSPALKRLSKAKKLAIEQEKLLALLEIIDLEIYITMGSKVTDMKNYIEVLYQQANKTLADIKELLPLKQLDWELFLGIRLSQSPSQEILDKVSPLLPEQPTTPEYQFFYALNHYYHVLASFYTLKKEHEKSVEYRLKIVTLWKGNEPIRTAYRHDYLIVLSNYLQSCHRIANYEPFPEILEEIESLEEKSIQQAAETFQNVRFLQLLYYINDDKLHKAKALVPVIEDGLEKFDNELNKARKIAFYYNITILYFALEQYRDVSKWINKIIHDEKAEPREDIRRFVWILEIIIHIEMENDLVLNNMFKSSSMPIRKKPNTFEKLALKHLKKISNTLVGKKEFFKKFKAELDELAKTEKHFGMEELSIWVETKITNKSFIEILRERNKKNKK